jgi:hypothetical protein
MSNFKFFSTTFSKVMFNYNKFHLKMKIGVFKMLIELWLSHISYVGSFPSRTHTLIKPSLATQLSFAPLVNVIYSTLVDEMVVQSRFMFPCIMGLDLTLKISPILDFISHEFLNQLLSKYLLKIQMFSLDNNKILNLLSFKYNETNV